MSSHVPVAERFEDMSPRGRLRLLREEFTPTSRC